MQDLQILRDKGATPENFRKLFTAKEPKKEIKQLTELHANRLRRAINDNLQEAPIYGAIDKSLSAAQDNLQSIQARFLAASGKTNEEIVKFFTEFGLEKLLEPVIGADGAPVLLRKNEPLLTFNVPLFENVLIPMVAAYCEMRVAKIFNDRNGFPRYPFAPSRLTMNDMMIADIITNRIQRMATDMGYADDDKQTIRQMVYYGTCLNFPQEAWFSETYSTKEGDKVVDKVKREGIRRAIPHPSRHFWDKTHPAYRINSDTGPTFYGYWDIERYSVINNNAHYWNKDKITYGGYDLFTSATWRLFQMFYPCVVSLPKAWQDIATLQEPDRIAKQQSNYLKSEEDSTVTRAVLFDKLNPKQWGLFDYDKDVWMRFIYANFDTCIYAEVLPYSPGAAYLDRLDSNKTVASSMALQMVPFAQLLGNFLTQHIVSVKQNLMRIVAVNTDIMPADQISNLKRLKDKLYQGIQWLLYSKKHNSFPLGDRGDQREATSILNTPQVATQELRSNIEMVLTMVERVLGISPQEVGQAASHEQSAGEVNIIAGATSNSLEFMATGFDAGTAALKRMLYTAFYCYGSDEVFAEVADLTPERKKALEKLGFAIEEGSISDTHSGVKGKKAALVMDTFISEREGVNRLSDSKIGIAMMQVLGQWSANPALLQAIGTKKFVELSMYVWKMVGLPQDFRIDLNKIQEMAPQQQQEQMTQLLTQMKEQVVVEAVKIAEERIGQQISQSVVEPITKEFVTIKAELEKLNANDAQMAQAIEQIAEVVKVLTQAVPPSPPQVPPPMMPMQPQADPALIVQPAPIPNDLIPIRPEIPIQIPA